MAWRILRRSCGGGRCARVEQKLLARLCAFSGYPQWPTRRESVHGGSTRHPCLVWSAIADEPHGAAGGRFSLFTPKATTRARKWVCQSGARAFRRMGEASACEPLVRAQPNAMSASEWPVREAAAHEPPWTDSRRPAHWSWSPTHQCVRCCCDQRGSRSRVNAIVALAPPLRTSILNCTLAGGLAATVAM